MARVTKIAAPNVETPEPLHRPRMTPCAINSGFDVGWRRKFLCTISEMTSITTDNASHEIARRMLIVGVLVMVSPNV